MSKDVQLAFPCTHVIGEERVLLATDRRSLVTKYPVAGTGLLKVLANNEYEVSPTRGVTSKAQISAATGDPYTVIAGEQTLTIRTAVRQATTTLPSGYLRTDALVSLLNALAVVPNDRPFFVAAKSTSGALTLTENLRLGAESQIKVEGQAAASLGFGSQFGAVGRNVLPSWSLYRRPVVGNIAGFDPGYAIQFNAPVQANYYFSVTYTTPWNLCPRCRATEVENDYRFDTLGEAVMVEGNNLLYQECLKIVLTDLGSNVYSPWYGSNVSSSIGSKLAAGSAAAIQASVRKALDSLQGLQSNQAKYQQVTAKERLYAIDQVSVTPSPQDPTAFLIELSVRSYSFDAVNITIVYTSPGAYALPGTNQLSLGNYG